MFSDACCRRPCLCPSCVPGRAAAVAAVGIAEHCVAAPAGRSVVAGGIAVPVFAAAERDTASALAPACGIPAAGSAPACGIPAAASAPACDIPAAASAPACDIPAGDTAVGTAP